MSNPTPEQIAAIASAIRSGAIRLSEASVRRWAVVRDDEQRMDLDEPAQRDRFILAGALPDDACPTPAWFKGS